jgi:hypothetical protein
MKARCVLLLVLALTIDAASGETLEETRRAAYSANWKKLAGIENRMRATRPGRRETPVRPGNIHEEEVREIQRVTSEIWPGAIIKISTVVVGCPCEDGPFCSDQVWILKHRPAKAKGLLLSRIDGHWAIGPVQLWWLDYENLQARRKHFASHWAYRDAEREMYESFPVCAVAPDGADRETPGGRP